MTTVSSYSTLNFGLPNPPIKMGSTAKTNPQANQIVTMTGKTADWTTAPPSVNFHFEQVASGNTVHVRIQAMTAASNTVNGIVAATNFVFNNFLPSNLIPLEDTNFPVYWAVVGGTGAYVGVTTGLLKQDGTVVIYFKADKSSAFAASNTIQIGGSNFSYRTGYNGGNSSYPMSE